MTLAIAMGLVFLQWVRHASVTASQCLTQRLLTCLEFSTHDEADSVSFDKGDCFEAFEAFEATVSLYRSDRPCGIQRYPVSSSSRFSRWGQGFLQ